MKTIMYHGQELLPISYDVVFKVVFGKNESKDILAKFLSAMLDIEVVDPESIELTNTEISPDYKDDKLSRFDVRAKLKDGTHIEIEIQLVNEHNMIPRSLYYHALLYVDQMVAGMGCHELKRSMSLNILDFNLLNEEEFFNSYRYVNIKSGKELSKLCEICFLELRKVPKQEKNMKEMWALFLATDKEEVIEMLAKKNKDIEKAVEKLKYVSADENVRSQIRQIEKERMDYEAGLKYSHDKGVEEGIIEGIKEGREEGREEGIKEGIKEGIQLEKYKVARAMKANGIDEAEIVKCTELSLEEIRKLK